MTATPSPTLLTAGGTPVSLLPLSTAWPSADGCSSNIYEQEDGHFLGWDPYYGQSLVTEARTCLPPQVTSWWDQSSAGTSTALGPNFVCPAAYSAVQTSLIASETQYIYCCPSGYGLYVVQPNTVPQAFPSQCTSLAPPGQEMVFLGPLQLSDGIVFTQTTSTVQGSTVTVFGIPVNGYNLAQSTSAPTSSSTTSSASSTGSGATSSPTAPGSGSKASGGTSSVAVSVGVSVGVVLGVLAIVGALLLLWRRRRRRQRGDQLRTEVTAGQPEYGPPPMPQPPPGPRHEKYELLGDLRNAELSGEPTAYELPDQGGGGSKYVSR